MVRQARSEATRRRIVESAVQLFDEIGYPAVGLGDIIERAEMTKGAVYYHFDSKEALASAIIDEGSTRLFEAFHKIRDSSAPALERIIHGTFVIADRLGTDMVARSSTQLLRGFGESNDASARTYGQWLDEIAAHVKEAIEEGDMRPDVDPRAVAETIVGAMLGAEVLSNAASSGADLLPRLRRMWEVLLPAMVSDEAGQYFREYLARESMRHAAPAAE